MNEKKLTAFLSERLPEKATVNSTQGHQVISIDLPRIASFDIRFGEAVTCSIVIRNGMNGLDLEQVRALIDTLDIVELVMKGQDA